MLSIAKQLRDAPQLVSSESFYEDKELIVYPAIPFDQIPEPILHIFACDVAERVLQKEKEAGRDPQKMFYLAIKLKREWIERKTLSPLSLSVVQEEIQRRTHQAYLDWLYTIRDNSLTSWSVLRNQEKHAAIHSAAKVIYGCTLTIAKEAANTTSQEAAMHENHVVAGEELVEIAWQNNHMADLIEQYHAMREELFSALLQRWKHLEFILPHWQKEGEDALYS